MPQNVLLELHTVGTNGRVQHGHEAQLLLTV